MADEQMPQAGTEAQPQVGSVVAPSAQQQPPAPQAGEEVGALPEWAQRTIKELRTEQAARRKALEASERKALEASEQAAKEQGKWQELAQAYEPKAKRVDAVEAYIASRIESEIANVPEKIKVLVPKGDTLMVLQWLEDAKAAGLFAPLATPRTDAGSGNGQGGLTPPRGALSPDRKQELAARYGVRADLLPDTLGV